MESLTVPVKVFPVAANAEESVSVAPRITATNKRPNFCTWNFIHSSPLLSWYYRNAVPAIRQSRLDPIMMPALTIKLQVGISGWIATLGVICNLRRRSPPLHGLKEKRRKHAG